VWSRRSWLAWLRAYPGRFARPVAAQYRRWLATHGLAGSAATCRDVMRRPAWSWTTAVARPNRDRPLAGRARGACRARLAEPGWPSPAGRACAGPAERGCPSSVRRCGRTWSSRAPCEPRAVSAGNSQYRPTTGAVLRVMSPPTSDLKPSAPAPKVVRKWCPRHGLERAVADPRVLEAWLNETDHLGPKPRWA
jgi:hypothetical protein